MNLKSLALAAASAAGLVLYGCQDHVSPDRIAGPAAGSTAPNIAATSGTISPAWAADGWSPEERTGAVYTLSNESSGNRVIVFSREKNGSLSWKGSVSTGGKGLGSGLGSQGAIVRRGDLLFAVDAGSNEVSVLRTEGGFHVIARVPSGGLEPISLTVNDDLLYVLNAGDPGNITGFRGARSGHLVHINGSTQPLSGTGTGPAQVEFNPAGRVLVVTEKNTNMIDTYVVGAGGKAGAPDVQSSTGTTPFGFEFTSRGQLVVSNAAGKVSGMSSLTSYAVSPTGFLALITGPVADHQTAACWVAITGNGKFAYTTNAVSGDISGYTVAADGSLTLFNDGGVTASSDASPIDMALSRGSRFLFALNAGGNSITSYAISPATGGLTPRGKIGGLPASASGLAAE